MDESIQNFYIALEETRRQFLHHTSSSKEGGCTEGVVCELHESCDIVYGHIQKLWDEAPLPSSGGRGIQEGQGALKIEEDNDNLWPIMVNNCTMKAFQLVQDVFKYITTGITSGSDAATSTQTKGKTKGKKRRSEDNVPDFGLPGQAAIARMMELTVRLSYESKSALSSSLPDNDKKSEPVYLAPAIDIIQQYTTYQHKVLRSRSKPSIAYVANLRKIANNDILQIAEMLQNRPEGEDDEDESQQQTLQQGADEEQKRFQTQPYAHAIVAVLGQAISLIEPLVMWRDGIASSSIMSSKEKSGVVSNEGIITINPTSPLEMRVQGALLQMCNNTIKILDEEAQKLAITVGTWFLDDSPSTIISTMNANLLDNTVDEMAFICQMLSRYCSFQIIHILTQYNDYEQVTQGNGNEASDIAQHLQVQSVHYPILETSLTEVNIQCALSLASPVEIVVGEKLFVPSIIDDAYYISERALKRASGTTCDKAILTVGQFVCELWNTENNMAGSKSNGSEAEVKTIYDALLHQKGCIFKSNVEVTKIEEKPSYEKEEQEAKKTPSGGFASALLSALDQDIIKKEKQSKPKAPLSGSFLQGNKDVEKAQIDTQFCALNGIHAAAAACVGLAIFYDSLLSEDECDDDKNGIKDSKKTEMVNFAKEQLVSYSRSYTCLLNEKIETMISEQCGIVRNTHKPPPLIASLPGAPSLHRFFYYLSQEQYNLDANAFHHAESDERIEQDLLLPLQECNFIRQVANKKCDEGVTLHIIQNLSAEVVSLILGTILHQEKKFSEWGSLLFSKQTRMLEHFFCGLMFSQENGGQDRAANTGEILKQFRKLSQTITILRLSKPLDWLMYAKDMDDSDKKNLTKDEVRLVMGLRFTEDAIVAAFPSESR